MKTVIVGALEGKMELVLAALFLSTQRHCIVSQRLSDYAHLRVHCVLFSERLGYIVFGLNAIALGGGIESHG